MESSFIVRVAPGETVPFNGVLPHAFKHLYVFGRPPGMSSWRDVPKSEPVEHDPYVSMVLLNLNLNGAAGEWLPAVIFEPMETRLPIVGYEKVGTVVGGSVKLFEEAPDDVEVKLVFRDEPYVITPQEFSELDPAFTRDTGGEAKREYVVGIYGRQVEPGETLVLETEPVSVRAFTIRRILMPHETARHFEVLDVRSGSRTIMGGPLAKPQPAMSFSIEKRVPLMSLSPCDIGERVSIKIRNTSRVRQNFECAFMGQTDDPLIYTIRRVEVEAGVRTVLETHPICVPGFTVNRIVMPKGTMSHFEVLDLRSGGETILKEPLGAPQPEDQSSTEKLVPRGKASPCEVGQPISIEIRNTSDERQSFSCAFISGVREEELATMTKKN